MRKVTLVPVFVLFLATIQWLMPDGQANARHNLWHCCTPGMCNSTCWCCGMTIYCTCKAVEDDEGFKRHGHGDDVTLNMSGQGEPRAFDIVMRNIDERLQVLMKTNRIPISTHERLFGSVKTRLKLWCPGMDDDLHESEPSAVQTARD
jgi:hypothetical protein